VAPSPLTAEQLAAALGDLPGWRVTDGELTATYRIGRPGTVAFYTAVAAAEDAADHHARVTILYGTLTFAVNTHSAGGALTPKDTALAARIAALADEHHAEPDA